MLALLPLQFALSPHAWVRFLKIYWRSEKKAEKVNLVPIWKDKWAMFALTLILTAMEFKEPHFEKRK
jgi:hypothetical protein